jgi:rRNA-processing protein FCF1
MFIIANKHIPKHAFQKLSGFGNVIPFSTEGITYPSISCHPDIFFVQTENGLVVAPNLPLEMKNSFFENKIYFEEGNSEVGSKYPQTAAYNAVITEEYLIHNLKITDSILLSRCEKLEKIHVNQAYTRCNLLALKENHFITSDRGIEKVLRERRVSVLYINPTKIILPGMKNGFFGGCCGTFGNTIFLIGNFDFLDEGKKARKFIEDLGYKLVELYDGPLFDGGSLIFPLS